MIITTDTKQQILVANKTNYWLKKQLNSSNLKRQTKGMLHKTLIRPIIAYGNNCWPLSKKDGKMLRIFERRLLRKIYSSIKKMVNGEQDTIISCIRSLRTNLVKVVKIGRLRWMGQLLRMQELDHCRKLALLEPEGTRRIGKPKLRWLESVEEELRKIDWRRKSQD